MHVHNGHFERLLRVLTAGVVALLVAAPVLAEAAQPAAAAYVPTTADYLGVSDALQRYRLGVDKHDPKMLQSAFWEDGTNIAVPSPGVEIRLPLNGAPPQPPAGLAGPNAGPPPGANPGKPGPNAGPPPGVNGGPPGPGPGGEGGDEVWHLPLDSYIHFESATRATHYGYFLSIYPQKEKKAESGNMLPRDARISLVGWPGHYEDILEKRNGEWRILSRKSVINQK